MALIKVNSWSVLSAQGGFHSSPKDISINTNEIIGIETRTTPYQTTGVTNILYNYQDNNMSSTILVIVTDSLASLTTAVGTSLMAVTSWDDIINQNVFATATSILLNPKFVNAVRTLTNPFNTTGITDIVYSLKNNNDTKRYSLRVTETLDAVVTAGAGSGGATVTWTTLTGKPATFPPPNATISVRGGILQTPAQVNSVATDVAGLVTDFNALLTKLRTSGVITP